MFSPVVAGERSLYTNVQARGGRLLIGLLISGTYS